MHFFETLNGDLINERFVAKIVKRQDGKGPSPSQLIGVDGERLGETWEEVRPGVVVPASSGSPVAAVFTLMDDEEEVHVRLAPVIAWRVHDDFAEPSLLEPVVSNQIAMLVLPDGTYILPETVEFGKLEEAKAYVFKQLRG